MAISFIGSAFGQVAAAGADPITVDISGTGWQDGDLALAEMFIGADLGTGAFGAPAGWQRERSTVNTGGDDRTAGLFWRILRTGDDETVDFTAGNTATRSVLVSVWRGVDEATPFDAMAASAFGTNTQNPTNPAYTTITANTVGTVWAGITQSTPTTAGAPSGYTLRANHVGASFPGRQQELASLAHASPGTQTPGAWTNSGGGSTEESGLLSVALREAGVIANPPTVENYELEVFTAGTAHLVNMPASVASGELLVTFFGFDGTGTVGTPTDWVRLDAAAALTSCRMFIGYKIADGSEGGTSVDWVTSASVVAVSHTWLVDNYQGVPEFAEAATADPPSLTASWGAADNLWLTGAVQGTTFSPQSVQGPADFQYFSLGNSGGNELHVASSRWVTDTATVDPSTWILNNAFVGAWTFVLEGADDSITGTGASTLGDVTSAGSGTYTPAAISGTGTSTLADVTSSGSGTFTPPGISGTGASTLANVTSSGAGTYTPAAITGTGSSTLADVTSAGVGVHIAPITGTGASTLGDVTSSGTGVFAAAGDIDNVICDLIGLEGSCDTLAPVGACTVAAPLVTCDLT